MCGIAGYVGAVGTDLLPAMVKALAHRGPDDAGTHVDGAAGLGMTRLAIIDLVTGRQPMGADDGAAWLVFNGEIYNYRALRSELQARGHVFRTQSDTEVLLRAWQAYGEQCATRLAGMFAFAVWDARQRRLVLGRDRLGKKPLYYWQGDGVFLFASEIKALLCHPAVPRALDPEAFHHYLAFGYAPGHRSMLAGIGKLPAAHVAVVEDGRLVARRYWSLPAAAPATPVGFDEAAARVRVAVRDAVRARLESDVPLGVFLSGGVDSAAVVASMRELSSGPIATFTVGFAGDASFDERPLARQVAQRFETRHHEEVLVPDVAGLLPGVVDALDEPFADSSAIPTFAVSMATSRHVKVALSGIGGDEAFAGYPRYLGVRFAERYARLPRTLRTLVARVAERIPESDGSHNWGGRLRRFAGADAGNAAARYIAWTRFFGEATLAELGTTALRAGWREDVEAAARTAFEGYGHDDPVDGAFRADLATYLSDDLLVMADRMSMAHSLELRAPFCDHALLETSLALPPALKLRGGRLKALLKAAFADVLPPAVLAQPKRGFMIPLARWLRHDLRDMLRDLLAPEHVRARGLFEPAAVARLVAEHLDGTRGHGDRLWTLMMTELWMRRYCDRRPELDR
jgi:asparagine synthase (glutamine-hydrolysing)